jgi:hypothetical protein
LKFILGEVFGVSDAVGTEVVGVSPANFRKRLSRARQGQSGLVRRTLAEVQLEPPG